MMRPDRNTIPNAASPTMSSGWRELRRVIRLSVARSVATAPSPATHKPGASGTPLSVTSPITTQGRKALMPRQTPATSGMKYARIPGRNNAGTLIGASLTYAFSPIAVLALLVPGHLNGIELRLIRRLRIVIESVEREHPLPQVGEPKRQRIDVGKFLGEGEPD